MKKIIFMIFIFLLPLALIAQVVEPPTDVLDVIVNFKIYLGSLEGVSVLVPFLSAILIGLLNIENKYLKWLISWIVAAIVIFVSSFLLKIGYLIGEPVSILIINVLAVGLIANGIFSLPVLKPILQRISEVIKEKLYID